VTKVDFYFGSTDKLRTACQLSHKAVQKGVRTTITIADEASYNALNKLLWNHPITAFIPHCLSDAEEAKQTPVVLNYNNEVLPHHDLLISLHDSCVPFFSRFDRVIEIVSQNEDDRRLGRERFKFYRDRGYEIRNTDLSKIKNT